MNTIKTIIEKAKSVINWVIVVIIAIVFFIFISSILKNGWLGFLLFLISIALIYVYKGWGSKCPNCNKLYALAKEKTDVSSQKEIHVPVETNRRNADREIIGTHEQYVPGKRITYKDTYKCKFCGNSCTGTRTVDKANI